MIPTPTTPNDPGTAMPVAASEEEISRYVGLHYHVTWNSNIIEMACKHMDDDLGVPCFKAFQIRTNGAAGDLIWVINHARGHGGDNLALDAMRFDYPTLKLVAEEQALEPKDTE